MEKAESEKKAIRYLAKNPEATVREIQDTLGHSSTSITHYFLLRLAAAGKIKRIPARWEVL